MNSLLIILCFTILSGYTQPLNRSYKDISLLTKQLAFTPKKKKDIALFGITPNTGKVVITLRVGVNSSQLKTLKSEFQRDQNISDVFDNIDTMSLVKESYRIKIRLTKTFKMVLNAQILGFNKFTDRSSIYSMGIVKKF